jgi:hypothetical protein
MPEDPLERAVAESRVETAAMLHDLLRTASASVLKKLAVDLVPPLFHNDYAGEASRSGEDWADAVARPRGMALPTFLVRVRRGPFGRDDVDGLRAAMMGVHAAQAALVLIGQAPLPPDVRAALGAEVPWIVDTEGLVHLMLGANVGVVSRVYETKSVNAAYFR